jgi:glucose-1-phosphate adenylyltransferase
MGKKEVALILAGGRGKRMGVLCDLRPKPVLPFGGNFRVIDFTMSNCVHSHVANVGVLVDYRRERLADYLGRWHTVNGDSSGLRILPPQNGLYKGTADAVFQNLDYLEKLGAGTVLVLSGDHIYKMDYRPMIAFHQLRQADVTMGVVRVPMAETHRFGTVTVDDAGRITEFREKSSMAQSNLASMGVYIFNLDRLARCLREDAGEAGSLHDFGYNILPRMVKTDRAFVYEFKDYWLDIGTVKTYYEANMALLAPRPPLSLNSNWAVLGENRAFPAGRALEESNTVNSLVSPGCVIRGRVENSILSPGVTVAPQALVKNSIIMAGTSIGYHSVVEGCILDERVNIGDFCYIGFGAGLQAAHDEITTVGQDVTVPGGTAIGRQCRVQPGLGPDAFFTRLVPSGTDMADTLAEHKIWQEI